MKKYSRYLCNFLIVAYLGVIYFTGVPETNTLGVRLKQKAQTLAFALGIWPSWSMFAPNPIKFDSKSYVEVTYSDGNVKEYDVEIELDGLLAPFRKARWMKYSQDNLRNPKQQALLKPALRHFFHKYNSSDNPVSHLQIKRKWLDVAPFSEEAPLTPVADNSNRKQNAEVLISQKYGL